jgi:hypothetical protein
VRARLAGPLWRLIFGQTRRANLSTPGGSRQGRHHRGVNPQSGTPGKAMGPRRVPPYRSPSRLGSLRSGPQGSRRGPSTQALQVRSQGITKRASEAGRSQGFGNVRIVGRSSVNVLTGAPADTLSGVSVDWLWSDDTSIVRYPRDGGLLILLDNYVGRVASNDRSRRLGRLGSLEDLI